MQGKCAMRTAHQLARPDVYEAIAPRRILVAYAQNTQRVEGEQKHVETILYSVELFAFEQSHRSTVSRPVLLG
jgi:hypothetical protein